MDSFMIQFKIILKNGSHIADWLVLLIIFIPSFKWGWCWSSMYVSAIGSQSQTTTWSHPTWPLSRIFPAILAARVGRPNREPSYAHTRNYCATRTPGCRTVVGWPKKMKCQTARIRWRKMKAHRRLMRGQQALSFGWPRMLWRFLSLGSHSPWLHHQRVVGSCWRLWHHKKGMMLKFDNLFQIAANHQPDNGFFTHRSSNIFKCWKASLWLWIFGSPWAACGLAINRFLFSYPENKTYQSTGLWLMAHTFLHPCFPAGSNLQDLVCKRSSPPKICTWMIFMCWWKSVGGWQCIFLGKCVIWAPCAIACHSQVMFQSCPLGWSTRAGNPALRSLPTRECCWFGLQDIERTLIWRCPLWRNAWPRQMSCVRSPCGWSESSFAPSEGEDGEDERLEQFQLQRHLKTEAFTRRSSAPLRASASGGPCCSTMKVLVVLTKKSGTGTPIRRQLQVSQSTSSSDAAKPFEESTLKRQWFAMVWVLEGYCCW